MQVFLNCMAQYPPILQSYFNDTRVSSGLEAYQPGTFEQNEAAGGLIRPAARFPQ